MTNQTTTTDRHPRGILAAVPPGVCPVCDLDRDEAVHVCLQTMGLPGEPGAESKRLQARLTACRRICGADGGWGSGR